MDTASLATGRTRRSRTEVMALSGMAFASLCWAAAFVAGKLVLAEMTPLAAAVWRYALATAVLLPFAMRQLPVAGLRHAAGALTVMIVCGGILYPWLFLAALSRTSATNTSLLIALNPVFTMLAVPLVGERLGRNRIAGVGLALAGAVIVITSGDLGRLQGLSLNSGDLLAVAAALMWAAFNLASRRVVARFRPAFANCVIYGAGALALALVAQPEWLWSQLVHASAAALAGLVLMAVLSSVVAGQLFLVGVRRLGVSRTVVFVYLVPVLTALLSFVFLAEPLVPAQAVGGVAVLGGVYWSARAGAVRDSLG